jgi:excisionase family DNA binding protein
MAPRRIFCEVVEGVLLEDRCLYRLSKVIEENSTCENCIVRELEKIRSSSKAKTQDASFISSDVKTSENAKTSKDIKISKNIETLKKSKKSRRAKRRSQRGSSQIGNGQAKQMYTTKELTRILGKAERTLQEWAQKGKIKAVRVGTAWCFPKEEIDRLLERKGEAQKVPKPEEREETPGVQESEFLPENRGETEKGTVG